MNQEITIFDCATVSRKYASPVLTHYAAICLELRNHTSDLSSS